MNYKLQTTNYKLIQGQSLIETLVAIFMLTTGLTTALGLAIYAFSSSRLSQNQIVATNLASEGIDVVRMMRDSNWLASDTAGEFQQCSDINDKWCYPGAYNQTYDIRKGTYRAEFNGSTWALRNNNNYNLYLQSDGLTYSHTVNGSSVFARMIDINEYFGAPYTNQNSNQELIVTSIVAWRGKNCPSFNSDQELKTFSTPCKITIEEHLTNWKDYK